MPPEPPKEPPKYVPPVSKPWVSQGSEKEIDEGNYVDKRPLVWFIFIRLKYLKFIVTNSVYFYKIKLKYTVRTARDNLNRAVNFKDLEADDKKDLNISIAPYADQGFETKYAEIETGIQVKINKS